MAIDNISNIKINKDKIMRNQQMAPEILLDIYYKLEGLRMCDYEKIAKSVLQQFENYGLLMGEDNIYKIYKKQKKICESRKSCNTLCEFYHNECRCYGFYSNIADKSFDTYKKYIKGYFMD